jgi:prepilin-type N-terminal cleavage/methylation domain-containing protein
MSLQHPDASAMRRDLARRGANRDGGFTVIELLVAMTITLLIAGALAGVAQPARAAFVRVPAELELQQRGRTALDAVAQALRASLLVTDEPGTLTELTVIVPVAAPAGGVLSLDQPDAGGPMALGTARCPNIKEVCGFTPGATAIVEDAEGSFDVFSIASANAGGRSITPAAALSQAYVAGSSVMEIDQFTFRLAEQSDGTFSMIRETAAGAIQPIVDFVADLSFEVTAGQVDVHISLDSAVESLRALMPPRGFRTTIKLRNLP